ncbi:hypothetical protein ENUP19_0101G0001, partial [Entamoeba nuttalli]
MIIINILILFICSCMSKDCSINSNDFKLESDCNNVSFDTTLITGEIKVNLGENNENNNINSFTIGSCTKLTLTGAGTIKKLKLSNSCPLIIETEIKVETVDTAETNNGILYYAKYASSIPSDLSNHQCEYYRVYKKGHSETEKCNCTRTKNKYSEIDCDSITDYSKMNLVDDCSSSTLTINQNWNTIQPTKTCTVTLSKNISSIKLKQQKDVVVTVKEEDTKQENAIIKAGLRKQNSHSQKSMTVEMDSSVTVSFIKVTGVSGTCGSNSVCVYTTQSDENLNNGGVSSNKCGTYYRIGKDTTCTCTLKDNEKTIKKSNFKESDCQDFNDLTDYTLTLTTGQTYTLEESLSFKSLTDSSSNIAITGQTEDGSELKEAKESPELKLKTMKIGDLNPTNMKLTVTDSVTYNEVENKNKVKISASRTSNKLKASSDNKKTFTATSSTVSFPTVSVSSSRYIILQKNSKITITGITGSCENTELNYCDFIASDSLNSITISKEQRTTPKEAILSTEKGQVVRVMKTGEMNNTVLCSIDKNDENSFDGQFTAVECPCSLSKNDINSISTTDNTHAECVYVVSLTINSVTLKGRNDLKEKLIVDSTSKNVNIQDVTKISNIQDNIKDITRISNSQDNSNSNTISLTGVDNLQSIYIGGSVNKLTSNLPLITT